MSQVLRLVLIVLVLGAVFSALPAAKASLYEGVCELGDTSEYDPVTRRIYFDTNSAAIKPSEDGKISEAAELAKARYAQRICLFATSSKVGSAEYNLELARKRGNAVGKRLVALGIDKDLIVIEPRGEAFGDLKPEWLDNDAGADRMVEIYLVE